MNYFVELVGFPGTGKSYITKKLKENYLKKKIIENDELFFSYYKSNKITKKIFFKLFYYYKKNIKFESNFLFKNEYIFLKNKINLIIKKKNLNKIINKFKLILNLTFHNESGKKRSLDNFKLNLASNYLKSQEKIIINDEGLYQSIFQVYKNELRKEHLKKIDEFLNSLPKPNLVILINSNFKELFKRTENRKKGFKYQNNDLKLLKKNFLKINKILRNNLKKKRINNLSIYSNDSLKKNILKIKKKLDK